MRWFFCHTCAHGYLVTGEPLEVEQLLQGRTSFPCITPLCGGRIEMLAGRGGPMTSHRHEIPLRQFFRAIHGFGQGPGAPASLEHVTEVLLTKRIVEVIGESVGQPERVLINQLVLEDGTRLHFASSTKGACLYYVEERGKSCFEVVDHELRDRGAGDRDLDGEPGSHREEARRGDQAGSGASASTAGSAAEAPGRHVHETADLPAVSESCEVQVRVATPDGRTPAS